MFAIKDESDRDSAATSAFASPKSLDSPQTPADCSVGGQPAGPSSGVPRAELPEVHSLFSHYTDPGVPHAAAGDKTRQARTETDRATDVQDKKKPQWKPGTPASFSAARARHHANVQRLSAELHKGAKLQDSRWGKRLPNACDWVLKGKTKLYALTETHDSAARANQLGATTGEVAYFGKSTPVPADSSYHETVLTDAANIELLFPGTAGYQTHGTIAVVEPVLQTEQYLQETLVHEVQHDADHHGTTPFERYKTEFDSYWIDRTFSEKSYSKKTGTANASATAADGTALVGFDNALQQQIFLHLYNDKNNYGYVASSWASDPGFVTQVKALTHATGLNLVDSVRIDDLYRPLVKTPPDIALAKKRLTLLNDHDRSAIVDSTMADTWRHLLDTLSPADKAWFKKELNL